MDGSQDRKGMHVLLESPRLIMTVVVVALILASPHVSGDDVYGTDAITRLTVAEQINRHRIEHGLWPLRSDDRLHLAAEDRITDMEILGYWTHESPEGTSPFVWLAKRDYRHVAAAENLAAGYETASVLVQAWMESPGHRDNILSPEFSAIGIAWMEGGPTERLSGKSIVVLFGREAGDDLPIKVSASSSR